MTTVWREGEGLGSWQVRQHPIPQKRFRVASPAFGVHQIEFFYSLNGVVSGSGTIEHQETR